MKLNELYPFPEERKKKKRLGRGHASGTGKTSGKGHKGARARAGASIPAWFEGGQMPLQRRLPKRGFKNPFKTTYEVVNLDSLMSAFGGQEEITLDDIYNRGLARRNRPVKVLGVGEVDRKLVVEAHRFSGSAATKISEKGGTVRQLEPVEAAADAPTESGESSNSEG